MKPYAKAALILAACLLAALLVARFVRMASRTRAGNQPTGAAFTVGRTETQNSLYSSATSASSDNTTFNSGRVLVACDDAHPLSRRIATLLAQRLRDCRRIERVDTATPPALVAEGAQGPDLFVSLNLVQLKENGLLSRSMKAVLECSLGSAPWQSSHSTLDATTPPALRFAWNATLESATTFKGFQSDRYASVARSIADEFARGISNQLETFAAQFPALPDLPRDFYGPYQPVADFDFLKEVDARRACSYCGLLMHNQTFWKFPSPADPVPQLQRILSRLETAQWKVDTANVTNAGNEILQLHQDDARLEIFRLRPARTSLPESPTNEGPPEFIVHYWKPFPLAEREAALEKLFAEPQPVEKLLPFQNALSTGQRDRFFALVEKNPGASPSACLRLAESCLDRRQTNAAVNLLVRVKALASTRPDCAALEARVASLAKKIAPREPLKLEVTPQICRELGFLEITNASQTFGFERGLGQPVVLFGAGDRGLKIYSLAIHPPQKGIYDWTLTQAEEGSRSTTSSSFDLIGRTDWQQTFVFGRVTLKVTAVPAPDRNQVKYTLETES